MTVKRFQEVTFGQDIAPFEPDTSLERVREFAAAVGWSGGGRFHDHEQAREEGLPGALVPGIMGMGFLTSMIHAWAPDCRIQRIDTVFRAPMLADAPCRLAGVVTDIDEPGRAVEIDLSICNADGETRVFGTATVAWPDA